MIEAPIEVMGTLALNACPPSAVKCYVWYILDEDLQLNIVTLLYTGQNAHVSKAPQECK
jgi:hypothetical protein